MTKSACWMSRSLRFVEESSTVISDVHSCQTKLTFRERFQAHRNLPLLSFKVL